MWFGVVWCRFGVVWGDLGCFNGPRKKHKRSTKEVPPWNGQ